MGDPFEARILGGKRHDTEREELYRGETAGEGPDESLGKSKRSSEEPQWRSTFRRERQVVLTGRGVCRQQRTSVSLLAS